jgi:microcystin-dependent protein
VYRYRGPFPDPQLKFIITSKIILNNLNYYNMDAYMGVIMPFAGNFAPRNWMSCEGQLLAISTNSALFSILGTTYGGDGRNTFALPDLRGRACVGQGQGPGLSQYSPGQKAGLEHTTLVLGQIPAHTHPLTLACNPDGSASPDPTNGYFAVAPDNLYSPSSSGAVMALQTNAASITGGSQPFSNLRPYLALYQIICTYGLYPSRN